MITPISMIAAKSKNDIIGKDGGMPWHISDDLKHFKCLTMGHPIIMGRKTYDSIGKSLPGRKNIVITRNECLDTPDCTVCHSLGDALKYAYFSSEDTLPSLDDALRHAEKSAECKIFIIGGAQIYTLGMPFAKYLYITEIDATTDGDACFPEINPCEWHKEPLGPKEKDKSGISFSFVKYERKSEPKRWW